MKNKIAVANLLISIGFVLMGLGLGLGIIIDELTMSILLGTFIVIMLGFNYYADVKFGKVPK